uniref:Uncharacterized protein n=1 Tax=Bionectria ochroleuca TaxID=29856 RepID=A0A8H7KE84_BIOOC
MEARNIELTYPTAMAGIAGVITPKVTRPRGGFERCMVLKFAQSSVSHQQTYGHRHIEAGKVFSETWAQSQKANVCAKSPTSERSLTAPHWGRWTEPLLQEAEPAVQTAGRVGFVATRRSPIALLA